MDISGSYTLHAPREQVWDALLDPETLTRVVPGCESLGKTGVNEYAIRLRVDAAGVKGAYDGTLKVRDAQKPDSFRLVADGSGARGILHGDGVLRLEANDAQTTTVNYSGQAQLGGTIASIGVAVARHEAKTLINRYFTRLADALGASVPVAAATAAIAATPSDQLAPPRAAPLDPAPAPRQLEAEPADALASSLPRTAPIVSPAAASRPQAAHADALAATAPEPASERQQQPGWLQWFRRLLRRG